MKEKIEKTLLIAWMKFYPDFRIQPLIVIINMAMSGSPLFFFLIAGSTTGFKTGIAGAMVAIVSYIGITSATQDVAQDRYTKLREMMVAMPIHPASYAFGVALAPLLMSMPGLLLFMAVAAWLGLMSYATILWILVAILLCWISVSMLGFTISTYLTKLPMATQLGIARLLSLSIVFVPPVYYSETILGSFSWVSFLFPTSNAASLVRVYLGLASASLETVVLHWLILIVFALFFITLACFKTKWREK